MFIDYDFCKLYSKLCDYTPEERRLQYENLVLAVFDDFGVTGHYKIDFVEEEQLIGLFDEEKSIVYPAHKRMLDNPLSHEDMYEIIEGCLHEPEHVVQFEQYLKDQTIFPSYHASLPDGYGYFLQNEEKFAYTKTFDRMQKIIDKHLTCTGEELNFYSGVQTYLRERRDWYRKNCDREIQNFKVRENVRSIDLESDIMPLIAETKYFVNISYDVKKFRDGRTKSDFTFFYSTDVPEESGKMSSSICTVYTRNNEMYGFISEPSEFVNTNISFKVKEYKIEISNMFGEVEDLGKLQRLAQSVYKFINFYENEFGKKLTISLAKYSISDDSFYNFIKSKCFSDALKEADVEDISDIADNYYTQYFKFKINNYMAGTSSFDELLETLSQKLSFNKEIVINNKELFEEYFKDSLKCRNFKEFRSRFSDKELNYFIKNENLDTVVSKNSFWDKCKSIFKKHDDIER